MVAGTCRIHGALPNARISPQKAIAPRMTTVAFFSMQQQGHLRRLLPLVSGVVARGAKAVVFSHPLYEAEVRQAGAQFVDLFRGGTVASVDAETEPVAMRSVAFAARFLDDVVVDLKRIGARLVVYDTFALVGRLAARELQVPAVNVCAGHNVDVARFRAALEAEPRLHIGPACLAAVASLQQRGHTDVTPFSYFDGRSSHLNIYSEPPEFLTPTERALWEPVAFFGSLPSVAPSSTTTTSSWFPRAEGALRVYISFGTIIWRAYKPAAMAALDVLCSVLGQRRDVTVLVSLGKLDDPDAIQRLRRDNVVVDTYVDQAAVLREADLFITHHGLNSTHEAIWCGVPMLSYPFFWDQPALAARCQTLGVALPLVTTPRSPLDANSVATVLDEFTMRRAELLAALATARTFEENVMARRGEVVDRVLGLGSSP